MSNRKYVCDNDNNGLLSTSGFSFRIPRLSTGTAGKYDRSMTTLFSTCCFLSRDAE